MKQFIHKLAGCVCFFSALLLFTGCGNDDDPVVEEKEKDPLQELAGGCNDVKVSNNLGGGVKFTFTPSDSAAGEPLLYITRLVNAEARYETYYRLENLKIKKEGDVITTKFKTKAIMMHAGKGKRHVSDGPGPDGKVPDAYMDEDDYTWTYNVKDHQFVFHSDDDHLDNISDYTGTWDPTLQPYTGLGMHYYTDGWYEEWKRLTGESSTSKPEPETLFAL